MELTLNEKRGLSLFNKLLKGMATEKEREEYIRKHATYEEKRMGKLLPEMDGEDFEAYKALEYNLQRGERESGYCPICRNKGFSMIVESGKTTLLKCVCETKRANLQEIANSDFARLITTRRFDNFKIDKEWRKDALHRVKAWIGQKEFPVLYLGGKSGTGKSHLGIAAFYELVQRGQRGRLISWRDESRDLKFRMTEYGYYDKKIRELKTVPLLMIDDFLWNPTNGRSQPSDEDLRLAKEILDGRINMGLRTIITSNYAIGELNRIEVVLGGRIYQAAGTVENFCLGFSDSCENYRANRVPSLIDMDDVESPYDDIQGRVG